MGAPQNSHLTQKAEKLEDLNTPTSETFFRVMTRKEAARYIGIGQRLFDEYVAMKLISVIRYPRTRHHEGRRVGFRREDLDEFINSNIEKASHGRAATS